MSGIIKKIFKLFAYLVLVLVIFVAAVTGVFIATFDANEYKQDLADLVREQTGRDLQFYGDVSLTIYPALGMELGALSFSNAGGFGDQPMIKVNKVSISVDVASLIAFSPEVDQLVLSDLDINLQKNKSGVTNWDDLVKPKGEATATETAPSDTSGGEPIKISGAFGGLNIQNARLLWKDAQADVEYRVSDLDLTTGRITPDAPFPLTMHIAVQSGSEIDAVVDFTSQFQYFIDTQLLKLDDLALKLDAKGSLMPFDPLNVEVGAKQILLDPNARSIDLKSLALALNDLQIGGDVTVHDYAQPAVSFKLAADTLDVDALLGTPPAGSQPPKTDAEPVKTGSAEDVEIKLPMELLRTLQIDGDLKIAKLKIQNLWMQQINLGVKARDGVIDLKPMKLSLYEGGFDGAVQIDAKGNVPIYKVSKKLKNVQVGKLLVDFMGDDKISGTMNTGLNVSTSGEWLSELKKNSNGTMSLAFTDGALNGFNLRNMIEKAKAKLSGSKAPDESAQKTDFSSLTLTGIIKNGVFSSDDLDLQAPAMRVGGKGKADLNSDTVNYLVKAKIVATLKGQEGGSMDELSGLLIPVRIKGPFTDPKIDVQYDEMLKAKTDAEKAKIKAALDAEKAVLKKQLAEEKTALKNQIAEEKAALKAAQEKKIEKQKAVLEAKKKAAKEKAKRKLEDKLKNLLD
jgi:AsmA protein